MKIKHIYIISIVIISLLSIGCSNNTSTQKESSQYDRTPYVVYTYDGGKEIVLYSNPNTASVNGKSGSWTDGHKVIVNGESIETHEYYIVWYGSNTCVIWIPKGMIYWGSEEQAISHLDSESNWTICRKKRL